MITRTARQSDAEAIFKGLAEIASEIPVRLDTEDRQRKIFDRVKECCNGSTSWVALDESRRVVGFLLGEKRSPGLTAMEPAGVELSYGGVLKASRGGGQFSNLLLQAKSLGMPLYAVVKDANSGKMAARLTKAGFIKHGSFPGEITLIWTPSVGLLPQTTPP